MSAPHRAASVGATLRAARERLARGGVAEASRDADLLFADLAGWSALDLILRADEALPPALAEAFDARLARRLDGEPVGRILGQREFWGLAFALSPATLEPRADSETLILEALAQLGARRGQPLRVLDLGTGTGCLLVALLSECPLATGLGVDVSAEAVAAAAANAARHGLAARAGFRQGDWFAGLEERFDVILANPPYIARAVIQGLAREVRAHDPLLALDGGEDGLEAYRAILAGARACLEPDGIVILELGAGQAEAVRAIAAAEGLVQVGLRADLGGHPRALALRAWGPKPVQEPP